MSSESLPLASYLREHTTPLHHNVEQHPWVIQLLKGSLPLSNYYLFLNLLLEVYEELESYLAEDSMHMLFRKELMRTDKLKQDLHTFSKLWNLNDLKDSMVINPYARHLRKDVDLEMGVGHFYTRYFGDFQGGQILKQTLKTLYNLPEQALNFYDFSEFKAKYPQGIDYLRGMINDLPFSKKQKARVLLESKQAFILSSQLMDLCL
ncbi:biliverdin-producing heme oxygenase [Legionella yabuuchiae]|uniref:biliverdin-producing heme oxygenase n=1 Tax=Legionella yabuuchiae TaxID=376727 RepID=UPI00105680EB|nr:biliverdin-producing heme oxygenase [Legionella yabuuchiae]